VVPVRKVRYPRHLPRATPLECESSQVAIPVAISSANPSSTSFDIPCGLVLVGCPLLEKVSLALRTIVPEPAPKSIFSNLPAQHLPAPLTKWDTRVRSLSCWTPYVHVSKLLSLQFLHHGIRDGPIDKTFALSPSHWIRNT